MAGAGIDLIRPEWPAPASVRAFSSTRAGGVSAAPYDSLNLGDHVGDEPGLVAENRARLARAAGIDARPGWLDQVHGTSVADFDAADPAGHRVAPVADAAVTSRPGRICAIMTADCLPVLLTNRAGTVVAAAHGGWRGLAAGVLEATVAACAERAATPATLLAWLGPAIGPAAYEVGPDVVAELGPGDRAALAPGRPGHWLLDLYALARARLLTLGVEHISGGDACTHGDSERFFSYRRDGVTGRQATMIWLAVSERSRY
jgi:YfiH family protein